MVRLENSPFAEEEANIMFRLAKTGLVSILLITLVAGCMSPKGNTAEEKRQAAQSMRSETLAQLYKVHPYAKTQIGQAAG